MSDYGPATPVPIFQHVAEFVRLLNLYKERRPMRTLEVGSYHGGTLYHWLQHAPFGAVVVSVDTYTAADNRSLYPDWTPEGVTLHVIEGDSNSPATAEQAAEHGPFDWTFIDAGHYYHEVKADWTLYKPLTAPGGVVAFHDILPGNRYHPEIEVNRLWREIQAEGYETEEIIHDAAAIWGGIGVVVLRDYK